MSATSRLEREGRPLWGQRAGMASVGVLMSATSRLEREGRPLWGQRAGTASVGVLI
jgi:hypothetical protein